MAYEHFYQFYDSLMDDVPYQKYIDLVRTYAKNNGFILDIGCGTGNVLVSLVEAGYKVDGLDISDEMLLITNEKLKNKSLTASLFCDDMTDIELKNYYNIVYSFLDTINYLRNLDDVKKTFKNVYDALVDEGYFIFDVHSLYKVHHIFDGYCYNDNNKEFTYLWNTYVTQNELCSEVEHELTFFIKQNNLYKRLDEYHIQVVFSFEMYKKILEDIGFTVEKVIFDFDETKTQDNCDKIIYIAKKKGK